MLKSEYVRRESEYIFSDPELSELEKWKLDNVDKISGDELSRILDRHEIEFKAEGLKFYVYDERTNEYFPFRIWYQPIWKQLFGCDQKHGNWEIDPVNQKSEYFKQWYKANKD